MAGDRPRTVPGAVRLGNRTAPATAARAEKWATGQGARASAEWGQIVGRMRALEPDAQLVAVAVEQLLGQPEAEHVRIEMGSIANLLGRYQHVIEARRILFTEHQLMPDQVADSSVPLKRMVTPDRHRVAAAEG